MLALIFVENFINMDNIINIKERRWLYDQETDQSLFRKNPVISVTPIRYILGEERSIKGNKNQILICIGANPSTAIPNQLDPTLKRVEKYAHDHAYKAWYMINVYPWRETDPEDLEADGYDAIREKIHKNNIQHIKGLLDKISCTDTEMHVWCAWGNIIEKRTYLKEFLKEIIPLFKDRNNITFYCQGKTKNNHPCHPLTRKKSIELSKFDINLYQYEKTT